MGVEVQKRGKRNLIDLARYCGTSVTMLERHDVKCVDYVPTLAPRFELSVCLTDM